MARVFLPLSPFGKLSLSLVASGLYVTHVSGLSSRINTALWTQVGLGLSLTAVSAAAAFHLLPRDSEVHQIARLVEPALLLLLSLGSRDDRLVVLYHVSNGVTLSWLCSLPLRFALESAAVTTLIVSTCAALLSVKPASMPLHGITQERDLATEFSLHVVSGLLLSAIVRALEESARNNDSATVSAAVNLFGWTMAGVAALQVFFLARRMHRESRRSTTFGRVMLVQCVTSVFECMIWL
jgi:hypothetical protein